MQTGRKKAHTTNLSLMNEPRNDETNEPSTRPYTRPISKHSINISKRASAFKLKNAYADIFARFNHPELAHKLHDCEETQTLAACSHCGKSWYVVSHCRQRVCPLCSRKVAVERAQFLRALTAKMQHPKMVTLTQPPIDDDPHAGIKRLRTAFAKLRRSKLFSQVKGGAYQIEVIPKDGFFHIHMHILVDAPFIPYKALFAAWRDLLGCKAPQVDIRAASSDAAKAYVCKYTAKSLDISHDPENIVRWYEATYRERLWATFGEWYNTKAEELIPEAERFVPLAICPFCNAEKTIYFARDGPFIFGPDDWDKIKDAVLQGRPITKPIDDVREFLRSSHPELKANKEAILDQEHETSVLWHSATAYAE